jgi:hypothetical protein
MVAVCRKPTTDVPIVNGADWTPAGTVTEGGTPAAGLELTSATETGPGHAGTLRVTVPVSGAPPTTGFEEKANEATVAVGGFTVSTACAVPLKVAPIVAGVGVVTGEVLIAKLTL